MAAGLLAGLVSLMVALPAQAATFTTVLAESSSSSEDNWGPLALFVLGPVVYGAIHAFYRNPAARHRYEIDTDIKIDHLDQKDQLVERRTNTTQSILPGANSHQLQGLPGGGGAKAGAGGIEGVMAKAIQRGHEGADQARQQKQQKKQK